MKPPICPPQNVAPVDQAPVSWVTKMLFGRTWWLFFQGVAAGLANLLNFPLYHDLVMFWPGALTVAILEPIYPSPPQQRVGPYIFAAFASTGPTGANVVVNMWRSAFGSDPGGKMATFTILNGFQFPLSVTYFAAENYTIPGSSVYAEVTSIGSVLAGSNLRIIARVEGVS